MRKIKIQSILAAVAGLFLATSCSSSFLDTDPTDAVSSDKVSVPENAEALVNGAWYNLFTIHRNQGLDPEQGITGITYYRYPAMRTISGGINVSF